MRATDERRVSDGRRVAIGLVVALGLLAAVGVVAWHATGALIDEGRALAHEARALAAAPAGPEAAALAPAARAERLEAAATRVRWLIAASVALALLLAIAVAAVSRRFEIDRRGSQRALESANQLLSQSLARLERRSQDVSALAQMGELLLACDSVDESYPVVERFGRELLPEVSGALAVLAPSRDAVHVVARWGPVAVGADAYPPTACWALRRGREHHVEPGSPEPPCEHLLSGALRFALCVPMSARGEHLGVMTFAAPAPAEGDDPMRFGDEQRVLAAALAERVALSLSNLRLREELRAHSIRDALTGLFNRRFMEESLAREVARAGRGAGPLAVLMIDLDHFKQINDEHGHEAGDAVLRAFGEFLSGRVRTGDVACRYGGEEFALILPGATLADASARAEEIRRQAKQMHVRLGDRTLGPVTLSVGIAALPDHGVAPGDLLRAADHALYEAKSGGRDRVVVAEVAA